MEIPESSILEFLEKFSAKHFALSDAEDNVSRPINREDVVDLPLLRTLLVIQELPTLDAKDFVCVGRTKVVIVISYDSSASS